MLTLPIQKKWFDLIKSDVKKEEYREIKPYYTSRFKNIGLLDDNGNPTGEYAIIHLRNGYAATSPTIAVECTLKIGEGKKEWGAWPNVKYYILCIDKIYHVGTVTLKDFSRTQYRIKK